MTTFKSQGHKALSFMAGDQTDICLFIEVTAADEGAFIGPVHKVFPVRFVVFEELTIKLEVLSDLNNNIISLDAGIPSAGAEGECTHCHRDVVDCSFFSMDFLEFDVSKLGILVSGK